MVLYMTPEDSEGMGAYCLRCIGKMIRDKMDQFSTFTIDRYTQGAACGTCGRATPFVVTTSPRGPQKS